MFHKDVLAKIVMEHTDTPPGAMAAFRSRPLLVFALLFTLSGLRAPLDAQPPESCDQSWGHWRGSQEWASGCSLSTFMLSTD